MALNRKIFGGNCDGAKQTDESEFDFTTLVIERRDESQFSNLITSPSELIETLASLVANDSPLTIVGVPINYVVVTSFIGYVGSVLVTLTTAYFFSHY